MSLTFEELVEQYRREELGLHGLNTIIVDRFLTPQSLDSILAALPSEARSDLARWMNQEDFAETGWISAGIDHRPSPAAVAAAAEFRARAPGSKD